MSTPRSRSGGNFDSKDMLRLLQPMERAFEKYPLENREAYGLWLRQQYAYVSHSTRLLAASAARFKQEDGVLHQRFLEHTREETAHEVLAERDLKALGYQLSDFPELPATMQLYQSQYYRIEHVDPRSLFGYILCLEIGATLVCAPALKRVEKVHGKKCGTFLQVHANEDPDHVEKATDLVKDMLRDILLEIESNFIMSCAGYVRILEEAGRYIAHEGDLLARELFNRAA